MKYLIFIFVVIFGTLCQSRHIHPGGIYPDEISLEEINVVEKDIPIEVIPNTKPMRFVPLNSVLFFKSFDPCDHGYRRDALGVCREVW